MNQNLSDVFENHHLPFKTFFSREVNDYFSVHHEIELIWVIRGNVELTIDNMTYNLYNQTLFMINANQVHTVHSSSDSIIITYRFCKEHLIENNLIFDHLPFVNRIYQFDELVVKYQEVPILIKQLINLLISEDDNKVIRYKIIGYYNMFVYELYTMLLKEKYLDIKKKNYSKYISRLNETLEYVHSHFKEKINIEDISSKIGISKFRLSHFITEYIGISFQDYVSNVRLNYALHSISNTNMPIQEVSKEAGFSDVKYLNKMIRERFGTTALKYRKNLQEIASKNLNTKKINYLEFVTELKVCLEKKIKKTNI